MNECGNKTTIEKLNPFLTNDKIDKIYDYLLSWKMSYWNGEDMSNFLCGLLEKIRNRTKTEQLKAIAKITDKTNDDVSKIIKDYTGLGGRKYRKTKKYRISKYRKSIKSRK